MILLVNTKSLMARHWNYLMTCSFICPEYWLFLVGISPEFVSWNTCSPGKVATWASSQPGACVPRTRAPREANRNFYWFSFRTQSGCFIVIVNLLRFNIDILKEEYKSHIIKKNMWI